MTSQARRVQVPGTDLPALTAWVVEALAGRYTVDPGPVESVTRAPLETVDHYLRTLTVRDGTTAVARVELNAVPGDDRTRLTVLPLQGYERAAARVLGLLDGLPRAEPAGVAAAPPAEEPARRPSLTRDTPAPQAVADVVAGYLATMRANVDGVIEDTDTEFLHDFRVAVRRTRSALKLSRAVLDPATVRRREAAAKRLGDLTTPLRDLDVHLLGMPRMRSSLVSAEPADLVAFEEHLRARRAAAHRTLVRALRAMRTREFLTDWSGELVVTAGEPTMTANDLSRRCIGRAHRRVVKVGTAITAGSPAEDLHTLRKRCKELRYALEMFTPLHDPETAGKAISDLKKLQDVLGRFQDAEVQQQSVRAVAEEMSEAASAPVATLLAMAELATHLEAAQAAARSDFAGAFERFMRPASRRRLRAMGSWPAGLSPGRNSAGRGRERRR